MNSIKTFLKTAWVNRNILYHPKVVWPTVRTVLTGIFSLEWWTSAPVDPSPRLAIWGTVVYLTHILEYVHTNWAKIPGPNSSSQTSDSPAIDLQDMGSQV